MDVPSSADLGTEFGADDEQLNNESKKIENTSIQNDCQFKVPIISNHPTDCNSSTTAGFHDCNRNEDDRNKGEDKKEEYLEIGMNNDGHGDDEEDESEIDDDDGEVYDDHGKLILFSRQSANRIHHGHMSNGVDTTDGARTTTTTATTNASWNECLLLESWQHFIQSYSQYNNDNNADLNASINVTHNTFTDPISLMAQKGEMRSIMSWQDTTTPQAVSWQEWDCWWKASRPRSTIDKNNNNNNKVVQTQQHQQQQQTMPHSPIEAVLIKLDKDAQYQGGAEPDQEHHEGDNDDGNDDHKSTVMQPTIKKRRRHERTVGGEEILIVANRYCNEENDRSTVASNMMTPTDLPPSIFVQNINHPTTAQTADTTSKATLMTQQEPSSMENGVESELGTLCLPAWAVRIAEQQKQP